MAVLVQALDSKHLESGQAELFLGLGRSSLAPCLVRFMAV